MDGGMRGGADRVLRWIAHAEEAELIGHHKGACNGFVHVSVEAPTHGAKSERGVVLHATVLDEVHKFSAKRPDFRLPESPHEERAERPLRPPELVGVRGQDPVRPARCRIACECGEDLSLMERA